MKKIITILLSLIMIFCLTACGDSAGQAENPSTENNSAESGTVKGVESSTDGNAQTESSAEDDVQTSGTGTQAEPESTGQSESGNVSNAENAEFSETQGSKVLVAYFSATGTTEGVAEHIANGLDADIYEIIPEEPYTDADLNYNDNNSRSTIEMNDPSSRPAISGSVENMEQYDIVFIGYPIWWGEAPRIVSTFVESYDFSGKTIIPFATSGGSGMGKTNEGLEKSCLGAKLIAGKLLNGVSNTEMKTWAESVL